MSNAAISHHAADSSFASKARDILDQRIAKGRASAAALFERLATDVPQDQIVRSRALSFGVNGSGALTLEVPGCDSRIIHKNARAQVAARAGVPGGYIESLVAGEPWGKALAGYILGQHYGQADSRNLIRSVRGEVRGFLSDSYRRLDSRPLADAVAEVCQQTGAVPVDGTFTDTRVALKVLYPQVFEPVPGEVLCLGGEWSNSDFGNGTHSFRGFVLRLWCLNGATTENALRQVHLGGRLADNIEFSDRTYQLDTRTSVSALKDVVRGTFGPKSIESSLAAIRTAHEAQVEWKQVGMALGKALTKTEAESAKGHFDGPDVYNLPEGKTMWRASNAISWLANQTEDAERRLDLERVAGSILKG